MKMVFLENLARLEVRQFKTLFSRLTPNSSLTLKPMKLIGCDYTLEVEPKLRMDSDGEIYLDLSWKDKDEERSQTIRISYGIRNLQYKKNLKIYYFQQSEELRSKIVYYYEGKFQNRKEFKCYYNADGKSALKLRLARLQKGNPKKRYGQRFRYGKLTDYGKRCVRYEIAQLEVMKALYGELTKVQEESLADLRKMLKIVSKKKEN